MRCEFEVKNVRFDVKFQSSLYVFGVFEVKVRCHVKSAESGPPEFRCYEAKIEESEKVSSRRESNPGHL